MAEPAASTHVRPAPGTHDDLDALLRTIESLEGQRATLGNDVIDAAVAPLRKRLADLDADAPAVAVASTAERKIVTVMFVDVAGFTGMSERIGSEATREIVNALFERLVPVVERYGGVIDKFIGDEIMAVFGAPRALERHAERALRAAVEMFAALDDFNRGAAQSLALHAGINTGEVVAGEVGSHGRRDYSITGDTVNVAARLVGAARAGEVIVGPSTYRHAFSLFEFQPLEALQLKGKARPLAAYRLIGPASRDDDSAREGLRLPFRGRRREVEMLLAALGTDAAPRGVVFVRAEPGIGKTRLVAEFRKRVDGDVRWLQAGGQPYRSDVSYGLVQDLLDNLVGARGGAEVVHAYGDYLAGVGDARIRDAAPYLFHLRGLPLDDEGEAMLAAVGPEALRERVADAVRVLLAAAMAGRATVVCIEDLHWADASSVALLRSLASGSELREVLFVVTTRPERSPGLTWVDEAAAEGCERVLDLAALSDGESLLLLEEAIVDAGESAVVEAIRSKAQGNPLYLASFLRSLVDSGEGTLEDGKVTLHEGAAGLAIPDTVQAVVGARIDRLAGADKRVLQWGSVLGNLFAARDLAAIAQAEGARFDVGARLEALCDRQLLTREDDRRFAFVHALVRDVAYDEMLDRERRHLHAAAAAMIERSIAASEAPSEADVALLASHHEHAGDGVQASRRYDQAAAIASARHAHSEEAGYLESALRLAESRDRVRVAGLRERAGDALQLLGRYAEAARRYESAFECVDDADALAMARLYRKIARTWTPRMAADHANRSIDEARRCVEAAASEAGTPAWWRERIEVELFAMWALYMQGRTDDVGAIATALEPDIEAHATRRQRGLFHRNVALMRLRQQRYRADAETVRIARLATEEVRDSGDTADLCLTAFGVPFSLLWSGEVDKAHLGLRELLDETVRLGDAERNLLCLVYLAVASRQLGEVDSAEAFGAAAIARARANRAAHYEAVTQGTLAWVAWRRGDRDLADRLIDLGRKTTIPHYPFAWIYAAVALARAIEERNVDDARGMLALMLDPTHQRLDEDVRTAFEEALAAPDTASMQPALDACRRARYL